MQTQAGRSGRVTNTLEESISPFLWWRMEPEQFYQLFWYFAAARVVLSCHSVQVNMILLSGTSLKKVSGSMWQLCTFLSAPLQWLFSWLRMLRLSHQENACTRYSFSGSATPLCSFPQIGINKKSSSSTRGCVFLQLRPRWFHSVHKLWWFALHFGGWLVGVLFEVFGGFLVAFFGLSGFNH